jgi:beta-glucosidase-like glycosyl hydrolase
MKQLSLYEKIGQLLMVGIPIYLSDQWVQRRMHTQKIASYILFKKNTPDAASAQLLTRKLHDLAEKNGIAPLLIAIDQEYGRVVRINQGITRLPAAYGLGRINSPTHTFNACKIAGRELRALGINVNFAPVADVNTNPDNPIIGTRSYGEDPEKVALMVKHAIKGYQDAGIICSAKHFPGHGDVDIDSHISLPVSNKTIDDLYKAELIPFQGAIKEHVPIIMTAHIIYPKIDSKWPATVSSFFLTELLRQNLKFNGVVISDDLEMKALKQFGPIEDLAVKMILAGCDMLIISENLTHDVSVDAIFQALVDAVQNNVIPETRLNQAVERILQLKESIALKPKPSPEMINYLIHDEISMQMMREIFLENPDSYHFPVPVDPTRLLIITDVLEVMDILPDLKASRLFLDSKYPEKNYQNFISDKDEIFIFLSKTAWLEHLNSIEISKNQKIRFFSLNNPRIQSKIQIPVTSYINLYAECLPLEIFDGLIFANLNKIKK